MAKENTHLLAAHMIFNSIKNSAIKRIISENRAVYDLGSFAPDIFLYAKGKQRDIAYKIHGKVKEYNQKLIFKLLDYAKQTNNEKELTFILGYLTHTALDITFHPLVHDYRRRNRYGHRQFETILDKQLNNKFFIYEKVNANVLDGLMFVRFTSMNAKNILKKQLKLNKIFRSKVFFAFAKILLKLGMLKKTVYDLFYGSTEEVKVTDTFEYTHPTKGKRKISLSQLMDESVQLGKERVKTAYDYYAGKITKKQCIKVIDLTPLDYGK